MGSIEDFNQEMDHVYELLNKLESKDKDEAEEAKRKVDAYIEKRERKNKAIHGCVTKTSRTVINNKEVEEDRRKKKSDNLKRQGNQAFQEEHFEKAVEYYTSAILEFDSNPVLFTNRAQARIRLKQFDQAITDCKEAIKLNPKSIKAQVHLAKALHGKGELQKAIDILEIAEECSKEHTDVIAKYKMDIITDMKKTLLNTV
ncbi:hypothetical protein TCAL_04477 [Tigriopus californicus]|uniref:Uncharacterized protein n=2 Tax=Tigriopus californicus TaxID=6832 RepID=A0A553NYN9_TIGCA|nr:hypothetical protein TCAL_04477 [Tigriopus californicus]